MRAGDWYKAVMDRLRRGKKGGGGDAAPAALSFDAPPAAGPRRPERFVQLGLDYGTSWSKMVFRDYEARGGEKSYVIFGSGEARRTGEFRFPSLICLADGHLWFGSEAVFWSKERGSVVWPSMKIRMALPDHYHGRDVALPEGFSAEDLAALMVAYLLQHARRAVDAHGDAYDCDVRMAFAMGVPMSEMDNPELCDRFVSVARVAYTLARTDVFPDLREGITLEDAEALVASAREEVEQLPPPDPRKWIRSEAEAALLWAFRSPDTEPGLYSAIDIGAGTTSASFFCITDDLDSGLNRWVKSGMAFYGAACLPPGGDAIDEALAQACGEADPSALRGQENDTISRTGSVCIGAVTDDIAKIVSKAFGRGYSKNPHQNAWSGMRIFLLGGGTEIEHLRRRVSRKPWPNMVTEPALQEIGHPPDLVADDVAIADRKFLLVAYGLSFIDVEIPSVATPGEIPPLDLTRRVIEMDPDNPNEFGHRVW